MASTNFRVFNEANAPANTYNDSEYQNATQRQNGVIPGMAISRMHNKMYYQWSVMATAIATFLSKKGYDAYDYDISGIEEALSKSCGLNVRQNSTAYAVGDVAYSGDLKTYLFLECVSAGTSGASIPADLATAAEADTITDGTVVWIVHRLTSGFREPSTAYAVGDIAYYPGLPTGWYLHCKVAGTTSNTVITLPSPIIENATVTDGTVTWKIRKISSADGVPIATILAYSSNGDLPSGYLLCDGSAVSRTMFPDLFAAIGTTYGAGDGSTTFNLPDYNTAQRFAQGSTVAGTEIAAGLPNIEGDIIDNAARNVNNLAAGSFSASNSSTFNTATGTNVYKFVNVNFDASRSNPIYGNSDTVQPPALTTRYIIKAFDGQTADSALIDITQYAQRLEEKADINGSNLVYHKDVITTSGTYTAPVTGLYKITVKGGGGGGQGGSGTTGWAVAGGGGGEGGTTIAYEHMEAGETATVVIGAGGAGGAGSSGNSGGSSGSSGGSSSVTINGNTITGAGGNGGSSAGGAGGAGTIPGINGGAMIRLQTSQSANAYANNGGGSNATNFGGGGSGGSAVVGSTGNAGNAGSDGFVWCEYYTPGA